MPRFSFGLRLASNASMVEFAARLMPDRASRFRANPTAAMGRIPYYLSDLCQLQRGNKFLLEGIYSNENEWLISVANTYSRKTGVEAKITKLLEELDRIGWEDRELKWYISGDNREGMSWHIPLFEEEEL